MNGRFFFFLSCGHLDAQSDRSISRLVPQRKTKCCGEKKKKKKADQVREMLSLARLIPLFGKAASPNAKTSAVCRYRASNSSFARIVGSFSRVIFSFMVSHPTYRTNSQLGLAPLRNSPIAQLTRRSLTILSFPLLRSILFSSLPSASSALSIPFVSRLRCLVLICLDFLVFFVTPAPWWIVAMEGRTGLDRGGFTCLRDLSRFRDGEDSLLAAREWREGAVRLGMG
jgi:hypothetical protein